MAGSLIEPDLHESWKTTVVTVVTVLLITDTELAGVLGRLDNDGLELRSQDGERAKHIDRHAIAKVAEHRMLPRRPVRQAQFG